jgi:hypothetical protein
MRVLDAVRLGHGSARKLTVEQEGKRPRSVECRLTAGSIVWRVGERRGIILAGFMDRYTGKVFVADEREWQTLPEAINILRDVRDRYLPHYVFYLAGDDSKPYLQHFWREFQQTIPFMASSYTGEGSFDIQVLEDSFDQGLLSVPRDGLVAQQLGADWRERVSELHGVLALIHLVGGMRRYGQKRSSGGVTLGRWPGA